MDTETAMGLTIELEQETDGRWIAEIAELPGCLVYGASRDNALERVRVLALQILADRITSR